MATRLDLRRRRVLAILPVAPAFRMIVDLSSFALAAGVASAWESVSDAASNARSSFLLPRGWLWPLHCSDSIPALIRSETRRRSNLSTLCRFLDRHRPGLPMSAQD